MSAPLKIRIGNIFVSDKLNEYPVKKQLSALLPGLSELPQKAWNEHQDFAVNPPLGSHRNLADDVMMVIGSDEPISACYLINSLISWKRLIIQLFPSPGDGYIGYYAQHYQLLPTEIKRSSKLGLLASYYPWDDGSFDTEPFSGIEITPGRSRREYLYRWNDFKP